MNGTLDVLNASTLNVQTINDGHGGMSVGKATTIDNQSTATIDLYDTLSIGGTLDVLNASTLDVTSAAGGMSVTGETKIIDSTATVTVYGDTTVGDGTHVSDLTVDNSTLAVTGSNGGMTVTGNAAIKDTDKTAPASTATIRLHDTATVLGTLDVLNASTLDLVSTDGGMYVGKKTTINDLSLAAIQLGGTGVFDDDVTVNISKLTLKAGGDAIVNGVMDVTGNRGADGAVDKFAIVAMDAEKNLRIADYPDAAGSRQETALNVKDASVNLLARQGDMEISHINVTDAMVVAHSNNGAYRSKTLDVRSAALDIKGYKGVTVASDENDSVEENGFEDFQTVINVIDSFEDDSITVVDPFTGASETMPLGLTVFSDVGGMDSTDVAYEVLYNPNTRKTVYSRNGKYYSFTFGELSGREKGKDRFDEIPVPDDLADFQTRGVYSLYAYNYKANPAYYNEGNRVYLEKENAFYYMDENGNVLLYGTLADKVKDDYENKGIDGNTKLYTLRDVGAPNYYDGWFADNASIKVDVFGDVDIRDTLQVFDTVIDITSRDGALAVADYFIDNDGDGIGDMMERSEWDIRGSVVNTRINKNIRIDHLALTVSVMDMEVARDAITSKTWYMMGSKLNATAETAVQVINPDDRYMTPAVIAFWSNDDLYLIRRDSEPDAPVYEPLGLHVNVRNGDVLFITRDGEGHDANTTDFYATASTVDIDVRDRVVIPEAMVNVDEASNNGGHTTFTVPKGYDLKGMDSDTVTNAEVFKLVGGVYTPMTEENFSQSERAYGSEVNIKSSGVVDEVHAAADNRTPNSHVSIANWTIEGATLIDGSLNAGIGQSDVTVTSLGDVSLLYNLNYLPEADRIAPRELTIIEGSHVSLTSTEGAVDLLYDYDSALDDESTLAYTKGDYVGDNGKDITTAVPDVVIAGDTASGLRSTLEILSADDLKVAAVDSVFSDVTLRSTASSTLFDRIDAKQTNLRVMAEADIEALHPDHSALIRFDDKDNRDDPNKDAPANASLTLSAEGDIGTEANPLHVDIPEALTLTVEKVTNLNIDAWKRDANDETLKDTREYLINQGYSTDVAELVSGDYLNYSDEEFYATGIEDLDSEKLAQWLLDRSENVYRDSTAPAWTNMVSSQVNLQDYILATAATDGEIEKVFGKEFADAARAAMADETSPYYNDPAEAEPQHTMQEILLDAILVGSNDEQLQALYALVDDEIIYNKLYDEGMITYTAVGADGQRVDGSMQDLINYLINNDAPYAEQLEAALLDAATVASQRHAADLAQQLTAAQADKAAADAAARQATADKLAADAAARALYADRADAQAMLTKLEADYQTMVDNGATAKQLRAARNAIAAQQQAVDALDAQIAEQQAAAEEAMATATEAKNQAAAAQQTILALQPETTRVSDRYAEYSELGGAETEAAAWQTSAERSAAAADAALATANAATGRVAEAAYEDTLNELNASMATLRGADSFSEASLANAIGLSQQLLNTAKSLKASADAYLVEANRQYAEAEEEYRVRQDARATAQIALDDAQAALEAAQTQADADAAALEQAQASGTATEEQLAALTEAANASAEALAEAQAVETAAQAAMDAAAAALMAAETRVEERRAGVTRTEDVIAAAQDAIAGADGLGYALSNTFVDPDARRFNVNIGQANAGGEINIANEGDINVVVDSGIKVPDYVTLSDSDVTVGSVVSNRGNVSIINRSGSILAADNGGQENVHGDAITLEARDSIGSLDTTFTVEETAITPTRVATATLVNTDTKTPFGGIIGIETAERFEDITAPDGTLYTDEFTLVPVVLVDGDGNRVEAQMTIKDLRELYAKDGNVKVTFGVMDPETDEQTGSAAIVEVRYDWVREHDETEGTELNAIAHNGDIYLTEKTGDVGAGEIRAAGDVVMNVPTGAIARKDDRTTAQVGGEMTVNAQGDVNLISEGDLTLNLNTDTNHVEITTNDATGAGDITIVSESEKPLTGSALSNGSVDIRNGGDIGTADQPMLIDTDAENGGTAHIEGDNVNVTQQEGALVVDEIIADGDLNLDVGGDITDAGNTGLGDVMDRVTKAQQKLTEAERQLAEAELARDMLTYDDQVAKAIENVTNATNALENARTEAVAAEQNAADANDALAQAQENYAKAIAENGALSDEALEAERGLRLAEQAAQAAEEALKEANRNVADAQKALDQANSDPVIKLAEAMGAIEQARADGASDEELAKMIDKAVSDYRSSYPKNGEYTDKVLLSDLEREKAEAALKVAQGKTAQAQAALEEAQNAGDEAAIARAQAALDDAQAAEAEKAQALADAQAALAQAVAETEAAVKAADDAKQTRDHAAGALEIAEDALAAQVGANDARRELEAAQAAMDNAKTDEATAAAQAAIDQALTKLAAEEYLLGAEEHLFDTFEKYPDAVDRDVETLKQAANAAQEALAAAETEADKAAAQAELDKANELLAAAQAVEEAKTAVALVEAKEAAEDAERQAQAESDAAEAAKADAETAKAEAEAANADAQAALAEAQAAAQAAQEALDNAQTAEEKTAARQALADAQQALKDAEADAAAKAEALAEATQTLTEATENAADKAEALTQAQTDLARAEADQKLADDMLNRMDEAVAAEEIEAQAQAALEEAQTDEEKAAAQAALDNAKINTEKAQDALAAAKQAVDSAAERNEALAEVEAAKALDDTAQAVLDEATNNYTAAREYAEKLAGAQAALDAAKQAVSDAQAALNDAKAAGDADAIAAAQAALDQAKADQRDAEALVREANRNSAAANAALQDAYDAMKAAEETKAETAENLATARQNLAEAEQKLANDTELAAAAADAADAKIALDEAQAMLQNAQNAQNEVTGLIAQLPAAEQALAEAQKAYDEAYQDYLAANTGIVAAGEGASDVDSKSDALDKAEQALEKAKEDLKQIVDDIEAIVPDAGLTEAEEALRAAEENANKADRALADAEDVKAAQDKALADAEQALADAQKALEDSRATATHDELVVLQTAVDEAQAKRDNAAENAQNAADAVAKAAADKAAADDAVKAAQDALEATKQAADAKNDQALADAVADAQKAADDAAQASQNADANLNDKVNEYGPIAEDVSGTSGAVDPNRKTGDAAIRVSGDADITSGGNIAGKDGGSLTVDTDGTLKVTAAGDVDIQSSEDVNIDSVKAGGDVDITANGDITSVGESPAITGDKVTLDAISTGDNTSHIGSDDGKPMVVDADELGVRGDEAAIDVKGDVKLDDIVAQQASIKADGNISQQEGTQLDVSELDLRAGGNIGSRQDPIVTNSDVISATGRNVYLDNKSRDLLVDKIKGREVVIDTNGNINTTPKGLISAHDLTIRALDNIGAKTRPIRLYVDGKLRLESLRGRIWYKNFFRRAGSKKDDGWRLLVDPETQISVYGMFADGAWLEVTGTAHYARLIFPDLAEGILDCECETLTDYYEDCLADKIAAANLLIENSDSEVCKRLWKLIADGRTLYDFVLGIFAPTQPVCTSKMYFEIDFGKLDSNYDGELEGEAVYVMLCVEGKMVCVQAIVEDGKIHLVLDRLGMEKADFGYTQFVIVDETTFAELFVNGEVEPDSLMDSNGKPVDFEAYMAEKEATVSV